MTSLPQDETSAVSFSDVSEPTELPEFPDADIRPGSPDTPPLTNGIPCRVCGEPVYRQPGARGRAPSVHPACKPSASGTTRTASATRGAANKAEREADLIAGMVRKNLAKTALLVSMADPFDGMAIMAGSKDVCSNVRAVMVNHDAWRQEFLKLQDGGSVVGLVGACLMIALPIAAHHGLIPSVQVSTFMEKVPSTLIAMQKKMETAEADLAASMQEAAETAPPPASAQAA